MSTTINNKIKTELTYRDVAFIAVAAGEYLRLYGDQVDTEMVKDIKALIDRLGRELFDTKDKHQYQCDQCHWIGQLDECQSESDFGYDQSCCPRCGNVMFDNLHGIPYVNKITYL
jgi:transcription initiation factor IIE alpha subunit